MKYISKIFKHVKDITTKTQSNPLGRWNIEYCNKKMNQKIDLSNEDHCGPCGQYIINKTPKSKNPDNVFSPK